MTVIGESLHIVGVPGTMHLTQFPGHARDKLVYCNKHGRYITPKFARSKGGCTVPVCEECLWDEDGIVINYPTPVEIDVEEISAKALLKGQIVCSRGGCLNIATEGCKVCEKPHCDNCMTIMSVCRDCDDQMEGMSFNERYSA